MLYTYSILNKSVVKTYVLFLVKRLKIPYAVKKTTKNMIKKFCANIEAINADGIANNKLIIIFFAVGLKRPFDRNAEFIKNPKTEPKIKSNMTTPNIEPTEVSNNPPDIGLIKKIIKMAGKFNIRYNHPPS